MPNWCQTEIKIFSSVDSIKSMHDHMKEAFANGDIETEFGCNWLGNLATYLGIPYDTVPCRGWVDYMQLEIEDDENCDADAGNYLDVWTMTAWGPMVKVIKMFADKYCEENKVYYVATEDGNALYMTNAPDYKDHYVIDVRDYNDKYSEFFYDIDDRDNVSRSRLNALLREVFQIRGNASTEDMIDKLSRETEEVAIYQYEFQEVDYETN